MKKLYAGNLSYSTTQEGLEKAFAEFGQVTSATLIKDKQTGNSKGFGFVEMADDSSAKKAMEGLNGHELDGRKIRVNEAKERS